MNYRVSTTLKGLPIIEAYRLLLENKMSGASRTLVIVKDNNIGRQLRDNLLELLAVPLNENLLDLNSIQDFPIFFPSLELSVFTEPKPDIVNLSERILARFQWVKRSSFLNHKNSTFLIVPAAVFLEKIEPFIEFVKRKVSLEINKETSLDFLEEKLSFLGYEKTSRVTDIGQYSTRGSIIDVFSPLNSSPLRIDLFNDRVRGIRTFSLDNQRSVESLDQIELAPVTERYVEAPLGRFIEMQVLPALREAAEKRDVSSSRLRLLEEKVKTGNLFNGSEVFLKSLAPDLGTFFEAIGEYDKVLNLEADEYSEELSQFNDFIIRDYELAIQSGNIVPDFNRVYFDRLASENFLQASCKDEIKPIHSAARLIEEVPLALTQISTFDHGVLNQLINLVKKHLKEGYLIILSIGSDQRRDLVKNALLQENLDFILKDDLNSVLTQSLADEKGSLVLTHQPLSRGFFSKDDQILLISEYEIFHVKRASSRKLPYKRSSFRNSISSLAQLSVGDIVVHELYGIGKFHGLKKIDWNDQRGEFLEIEYAGASKLYVPVYDFLKVGKYQGSEAGAPPLTQLGSGKWEAAKQKIRNEIASLTANLLKTYAARSLLKGYSFNLAKEEEQLFANTFEYVETEDQAKAIIDVLGDMESDKPMDRLVCGDVGYGKTEVAMRAAFKAVSSGKQVALVAPTTLLVDQHYKNFEERFKEFGYKVGIVNRFRGRKEIAETLNLVEQGKIDIIIGTHRLLQKDVEFQDLGLVIIDEEHKFGVAQKERLKRFRVEVDVLTLSATPIPRTLQQALHGTRELSVIETPPIGRRPVGVRVEQYSKDLLREAIDRELLRGGQVYVVQHLIAGLIEVADEIRDLVKNAKVEMAHGKLKGSELESIMQRFYEGETKVLVSTAIIDSGIDVSNANTIIILEPQDFGLAQLYQLRGRVGRGDRRANSYFLYKNYSKLTDDAKRRLAVIESQASEGNGFKLALQDMEIRGAGSLFGKDQSGHAQVLGYDMYFKILEEAVNVEKNRRGMVTDNRGEEDLRNYDPDLKLGVDLMIPDDLIPDIQERLIFYQRSLDIDSKEKYLNFVEEFHDRFGTVSEAVENFLSYMLLRNAAKQLLISKITYEEKILTVTTLANSRYFDLISSKVGVTKLGRNRGRFRAEAISSLVEHFTDLL